VGAGACPVTTNKKRKRNGSKQHIAHRTQKDFFPTMRLLIVGGGTVGLWFALQVAFRKQVPIPKPTSASASASASALAPTALRDDTDTIEIWERFDTYRRRHTLRISKDAFQGSAIPEPTLATWFGATWSTGIRITTSELETMLKTQGSARGIRIVIKQVTQREEILHAIHTRQFDVIVGADGARSRLRSWFFGSKEPHATMEKKQKTQEEEEEQQHEQEQQQQEMFRTYVHIQSAAEIKYTVQHTHAQPLHDALQYELLKEVPHLLQEIVSPNRDNPATKSDVTLRLSISATEYAAIATLKAGAPLPLGAWARIPQPAGKALVSAASSASASASAAIQKNSNEKGKDVEAEADVEAVVERNAIVARVPATILRTVTQWLNARAWFAGEVGVQGVDFQTLRLSSIQLNAYVAAHVSTIVEDTPMFLVGDAAAGFPFFRSLNCGWHAANVLAAEIVTMMERTKSAAASAASVASVASAAASAAASVASVAATSSEGQKASASASVSTSASSRLFSSVRSLLSSRNQPTASTAAASATFVTAATTTTTSSSLSYESFVFHMGEQEIRDAKKKQSRLALAEMWMASSRRSSSLEMAKLCSCERIFVQQHPIHYLAAIPTPTPTLSAASAASGSVSTTTTATTTAPVTTTFRTTSPTFRDLQKQCHCFHVARTLIAGAVAVSSGGSSKRT